MTKKNSAIRALRARLDVKVEQSSSYISKRTRFEIFNRDAFTCQYCGRKPPDVLLELDHRIPKAKGGTNDRLNLITSCADCNRGKSDKLIGQATSPDAAVEALRVTQEALEAKNFLDWSSESRALMTQVYGEIRHHWEDAFEQHDGLPLTRQPLRDVQIRSWLCRYAPEDITESFYIVAGIIHQGKVFTGDTLLRYITGVIKNRHEQLERANAAQPEHQA